MIVVDTSALIAIMFREPEADDFITALGRASRAILGAPTRFELHIVLSSKLSTAAPILSDELLSFHSIEVVGWEARFASIAQHAFDRFGKGRKHPAQLNFGDCMAYAVAKAFDAPLLFKGNDFAQTDIRSALD